MKKLMLLFLLLVVVAGCSGRVGKELGAGLGGDPNYPGGRGTTGVSTGADTGVFNTGSDIAPK